jgi:hypothetical protein
MGQSIIKIPFLVSTPFFPRSRDSVVGIATAYGMVYQGFGVRVPVGSRIISS